MCAKILRPFKYMPTTLTAETNPQNPSAHAGEGEFECLTSMGHWYMCGMSPVINASKLHVSARTPLPYVGYNDFHCYELTLRNDARVTRQLDFVIEAVISQRTCAQGLYYLIISYL